MTLGWRTGLVPDGPPAPKVWDWKELRLQQQIYLLVMIGLGIFVILIHLFSNKKIEGSYWTSRYLKSRVTPSLCLGSLIDKLPLSVSWAGNDRGARISYHNECSPEEWMFKTSFPYMCLSLLPRLKVGFAVFDIPAELIHQHNRRLVSH
jgi:hypothetical protein